MTQAPDQLKQDIIDIVRQKDESLIGTIEEMLNDDKLSAVKDDLRQDVKDNLEYSKIWSRRILQAAGLGLVVKDALMPGGVAGSISGLKEVLDLNDQIEDIKKNGYAMALDKVVDQLVRDAQKTFKIDHERDMSPNFKQDLMNHVARKNNIHIPGITDEKAADPYTRQRELSALYNPSAAPNFCLKAAQRSLRAQLPPSMQQSFASPEAQTGAPISPRRHMTGMQTSLS